MEEGGRAGKGEGKEGGTELLLEGRDCVNISRSPHTNTAPATRVTRGVGCKRNVKTGVLIKKVLCTA
jgi:hypothetical protein